MLVHWVSSLRQYNLDNDPRRNVAWPGGPHISDRKRILCGVSALQSPEVQQAIRDDYRSGKVEIVQGWIVSKTEALLIFSLALNDS